ncbi:MAG TPA: hypothetical protein VHO90_19280 [Bacteroidales bacterium]|nr:hypothetical protein [Bacteroidales bacterium]
MEEKAVFVSKMRNCSARILFTNAFLVVGAVAESAASDTSNIQPDTTTQLSVEEPGLSSGQKHAWHEMLYGGLGILAVFVVFIYLLYRKSRKQNK